MYFLLNKVAVAVFVVPVCYFFGWGEATFPSIKAVCFALSFAVSAGALMGTLYADSFSKGTGSVPLIEGRSGGTQAYFLATWMWAAPSLIGI